MKQYYDYNEQLNVGVPFNIWQKNFERWPFTRMIAKAMDQTRENVKHYQPLEGCSLERLTYPSFDKTTLPLYKISPSGCEEETLPVILYYHGGGFIYPLDLMMLNNACYYAKNLHCHVLLPEYRLAPDYSCKTVLYDCYALLHYASKAQESLHIDMSRLLIFGDSAGGALAAGVTLLSRDHNGPKALAQMLIYPVTDCELDPYPSMNELKHAEWTKTASSHMWHLLFKHGACGVVSYVAPMQHGNYEGLPQAYIEPQEFDTLKDQGFAYAEALKKAGVPVDVNLIRGTCHGFDNDITNPFILSVLDQRCAVMQRFLRTPAPSSDN